MIKVKAPSFKNFVDNKGLFDDEKTSSILRILLLLIIFSFPIIFKSALLTLSKLEEIICFDAAAKDDGSFSKKENAEALDRFGSIINWSLLDNWPFIFKLKPWKFKLLLP